MIKVCGIQKVNGQAKIQRDAAGCNNTKSESYLAETA
jgi:hypothetical protein